MRIEVHRKGNIIFSTDHFLKMKKLKGYVKITETNGCSTSISTKNFDRIEVKQMLEEIKEIIEACESVQESQESRYTKEQEKMSAYDRIKEIVEWGE